MRVHCKYTPTGVTEDWHHIGILIMQLLCRNDDLTYFLGEEKNVVYGSCKRLWFWVDGRWDDIVGTHIAENDWCRRLRRH